MNFLLIPYSYLVWHLRHSLTHALGLWRNFMAFIWHFFSLSDLLRTLLSPWRKMGEHKKSGLDLQNIMEVLILNTVMRVVGFLVRSTMLTVGLLAEITVIMVGFLLIILWSLSPLIVFLLLFGGIFMLF